MTTHLAVTGTELVQHAVDALSLGALYSVFALGIALIFGVMRMINFAHGELIMLGGFTLVLTDAWPLAARLVAVVAIVAMAALLMERVAFRPLRAANPATLLVTSFAVSFGMQNLVLMIAGAVPKSTSVSPWLSSTVDVGDVSIARLSAVTVVVVALLLVSLWLFLTKTSVGVQMRAAAEDFQTARILGIRANTVIASAFAISGVLAAVASVLMVAQTGSVVTTMGVNAVLIAFVATIVGGLGSLVGAVLGAMSLGILTVALQIWLPESLAPYRDAFVFAAVLVVLVLRPQGLIVARSAQWRI